MNAFLVEIADRPGEVARLTEELARRGINILFYGAVVAGHGFGTFVANNEDNARTALREGEFSFEEVSVITVRMADRPGEAARISRQLAEAGVNLRLWQPVDTSQDSFIVAIGGTNIEAARQLLGDQIVEYSYQ